jgi:hypothetical protein
LATNEYHLNLGQKLSAAGLIWTVILKRPEQDMPRWLRVISDYDTGPFKLSPTDRTYHAGLCHAVFEKDPETNAFKGLQGVLPHYDDEQLMTLGQKLETEQKLRLVRGQESAEHRILSLKRQTYHVLYVNVETHSDIAPLAELLLPDDTKFDFAILRLPLLDDKIGFSFRRPRQSALDLSSIAKAYGGGGHPAASGVTLPKDHMYLEDKLE